MARNILIVGAGVAGLTASIALAREMAESTPDLTISIFDTRTEQPLGEGGAISLTPVAQHYLDRLGILRELRNLRDLGGIEVSAIDLIDLPAGKPLGALQFADGNGLGYGSYKCRRVLRSSLSAAMLAVIREYPCISVHFEKKLVSAVTSSQLVTLHFADGTTASGDLLLGCDGVHSTVRNQIVEPGNTSEYTGVSFVQRLTTADQIQGNLHFDGTALYLARHGSLLVSYCDEGREKLFIAAIMRVGVKMVEGYQAASVLLEDTAMNVYQSSLRYLIRENFGRYSLPCMGDFIGKGDNWNLYPVYQVRQNGKWYTDRTLLLGDSAHAMPPREESAAFSIEDSMVFSQILASNNGIGLSEIFQRYENARRGPIEKAFDASCRLWQKDLDSGRFPRSYRDLMSPLRLPPKDASRVTSDRPSCPPTYESMSDLSVYALTRESMRDPAP